MARLPIPGSDDGTWGAILNDYLAQAHNADGTLKSGVIGAVHIADGVISEAKLDTALASKVNAAAGGPASVGGDLFGTTDNAQIVAGAIGTIELANTSVSTAKVQDGAITTAKIADGNVTAAKVAAGSITDAQIATGAAIAQSKIASLTTDLSAKADASSVTSALAGKANTTHTHVVADVTSLQTSLNGKASTATTITGSGSLSGGGDLAANRTLSLVNDSSTPGTGKYYGTDGSGAKGYHDLPTSPVANLDDLTDVNIVGATDGQSLVYQSGSWIAATVGSGGGVSDHGALTGLSDDDHPQYLNQARGDARYYTQGQIDTALAGRAASSHTHAISDVSSLQTSLDAKAADNAVVHLTGAETVAGTKTFSSAPVVPTPSLGIQAANKDYVDTAVASVGPGDPSMGGDLTGTASSAQIAAGAIVNADINASAGISLSKLATDPLARANHTGSQTASTISDFTEAAQDAAAAALTAGTHTGVSVTYNDAGNAINLNASPTIDALPAGVTLTVQKSGGTWPARPTSRSDITVQWKGADPSPPIVSSGTGGMLDNVDIRLVTP